jgi:hypothetical protein
MLELPLVMLSAMTDCGGNTRGACCGLFLLTRAERGGGMVSVTAMLHQLWESPVPLIRTDSCAACTRSPGEVVIRRFQTEVGCRYARRISIRVYRVCILGIRRNHMAPDGVTGCSRRQRSIRRHNDASGLISGVITTLPLSGEYNSW